MRVNCLRQEHKTMSPARPRTQTARSGDERTKHEVTASPKSRRALAVINNDTLGQKEKQNKTKQTPKRVQ